MQLLVFLLLPLLGGGEDQEEEPKRGREGENVCYTQELQSSMVNTSYLEAVRVKKHYACLRLPPVCAEWVTSMETRWREENITRTVNKEDCCPGYKKKGQGKGREKVCAPWCTQGCVNGECTAPETCSCRASFSGERCELSGCPDGRWGPDCSNPCSCSHGGHCDPVSGACDCTPGYRGPLCEAPCQPGTFGPSCTEECDCGVGFTCHPVTGDCLPCSTGTWGEGCAEQCRCDVEGTELCSHKDGRCFCAGNRFGLRCELFCPFGFINSTCLTQPLGEACQCPNDLYTCDLALGCICPHGTDCGLEIIDRTVEVSLLSSSSQSSSAHSAAPVIVSVLLIALVAIVLVIAYYRRRMGVMKRDLANRTEPSVYYSDPERDLDPRADGRLAVGPDLQPPPPSSGYIAPSSGLLLNNVRLTLDSQARLGQGGAAGLPAMVKNVNVDNFKLGMKPLPPSDCCRVEEEEEEREARDELNEQQAMDVNLYLGGEGKGKVGKADLDMMIKNNLKQDIQDKHQGSGWQTVSAAEKKEDDPFADFESKLNVTLPKRENM